MVHNLALEFQDLGHEVSVVSTPHVMPGCEPVSRDGIELTTLRVPPAKPFTWRHPERLFPSRAHRELADFIAQRKPDLVSSHIDNWDRIPTVVRACRAAKVPLVHTLNDRYAPGKLGTKALASLKFAAGVTTISAATKLDFQRLAPALGRAVVIRNGIDVRAAQRAEAIRRARPYVFCAARLHLRGKAIDVLISAFGLIAPHFPESDLLIAGVGPDAEQLKRQVAEAGLCDRIAFLGAVSRQELWKLYKGALFFVMPSRRPEGLGLVFLESMACGRPVIGTRSGGTPEIVTERETGLLIGRNEPGELADAMRTMLSDAETREAMGQRGPQIAARYDWPVVAESYLQLYRSCLKGGQNR